VSRCCAASDSRLDLLLRSHFLVSADLDEPSSEAVCDALE
jgi:hypothetical protein